MSIDKSARCLVFSDLKCSLSAGEEAKLGVVARAIASLRPDSDPELEFETGSGLSLTPKEVKLKYDEAVDSLDSPTALRWRVEFHSSEAAQEVLHRFAAKPSPEVHIAAYPQRSVHMVGSSMQVRVSGGSTVARQLFPPQRREPIAAAAASASSARPTQAVASPPSRWQQPPEAGV